MTLPTDSPPMRVGYHKKIEISAVNREMNDNKKWSEFQCGKCKLIFMMPHAQQPLYCPRCKATSFHIYEKFIPE